MRLVFAGTPVFAERALAALLAEGHEIMSVLTQPDRKSGRGLQLLPSPVKALALKHGLEVLQPAKFSDGDTVGHLRALQPEMLVVAAYGLILPQSGLEVARRGAINIHASLLPRWRGAAPIHRAILAGDEETGITLMRMDAGLDTGAMLVQKRIGIAADETTGSLHDRLAALGAQMIADLVRRPEDAQAIAQPAEGVTYARKIEKSESVLDWRKPARVLEREVRAFNPAPGARATIDATDLRIWRSHCIDHIGDPGRVQRADDDGIVVACGEGALVLTELQRAGGKRLGARDFLRGHPIATGDRFALPA